MVQHIVRGGEVSTLNNFAWALLAMWSAVVALSLWWNIAHQRPETAVGLWLGHCLFWLLGQGGIIIGFNRLRLAHDRIIALMYTDELTGIANRRIFLESLGGAISFALRHQTPLSIIMADLDDFKSVNDTFGHNVGDQVLQAFATLLIENSRQEDLAAALRRRRIYFDATGHRRRGGGSFGRATPEPLGGDDLPRLRYRRHCQFRGVHLSVSRYHHQPYQKGRPGVIRSQKIGKESGHYPDRQV